MLRDIAVFFIIYLVFRLIRNVFNPAKVAGNNFQSQPGPTYNRREEGKVNIQDMPNDKPNPHHRHDTDGEYIDYKEV